MLTVIYFIALKKYHQDSKQLKSRSDMVFDNTQHASLRDHKCKKMLGRFFPPDAFHKYLTWSASKALFTCILSVSLFGKNKKSLIFGGGHDPISLSYHNKSHRLWSIDNSWEGSKTHDFLPQKSENFNQIKPLSTFDCSLDDAEILRTHRWHRYFKAVSHSACFSGCRMHLEVLICATVIAPDHPQFWKKKKKKVQMTHKWIF